MNEKKSYRETGRGERERERKREREGGGGEGEGERKREREGERTIKQTPLAFAVLASSIAFSCLCFFSLSSFNIFSRLKDIPKHQN